jgi:hypothetical protein
MLFSLLAFARGEIVPEIDCLIVVYKNCDARVLTRRNIDKLTEEEQKALELLTKNDNWKCFGSALLEPSTHHMACTMWPA